jgi:hypothetical protein
VLTEKKYELGFDRSLRASLENASLAEVDIPSDSNKNFDIVIQRHMVNQYKPFSELQKRTEEILAEINNKQVKL